MAKRSLRFGTAIGWAWSVGAYPALALDQQPAVQISDASGVAWTTATVGFLVGVALRGRARRQRSAGRTASTPSGDS